MSWDEPENSGSEKIVAYKSVIYLDQSEDTYKNGLCGRCIDKCTREQKASHRNHRECMVFAESGRLCEVDV